MKNRKGDWIQTYSGNSFWPFDSHIDDIEILDIAHSLSNQCRYSGHCVKFYSVAEHCVLIAQALERDGQDKKVCLWGLFHDAAEAYCSDVPRPIKKNFPDYVKVEESIMELIASKYSLGAFPNIVKEYDDRILVDEKSQNMARSIQKWNLPENVPLNVKIECWLPHEAKDQFLKTYINLVSKRS